MWDLFRSAVTSGKTGHWGMLGLNAQRMESSARNYGGRAESERNEAVGERS